MDCTVLFHCPCWMTDVLNEMKSNGLTANYSAHVNVTVVRTHYSNKKQCITHYWKAALCVIVQIINKRVSNSINIEWQ
jgi:hypothetical protein